MLYMAVISLIEWSRLCYTSKQTDCQSESSVCTAAYSSVVRSTSYFR